MLSKKAEVRAFLSLYNDLKQALQDTLAPDIKALRTELSAMEKLNNERFDHIDKRLAQVVHHIDQRIDSLHAEMLAYRREILAHLHPRDDYEPDR